MTEGGEKPARKKEPRWPEAPASDKPHERARRAVNRLAFGIDTKRRIAPD